MGLKATSSTIPEAYHKIKANVLKAKDICQYLVDKIEQGEKSFSLIQNYAIPNLRGILSELADPSLFPPVWIQAIEDYAKAQTLQEVPYAQEYTDFRAYLSDTLTACVDKLAKDGSFTLQTTRIASDGVITYLNTDSYEDLKIRFETLIAMGE